MLNPNYNGIAPDTRSAEDKAKDYQHEELFHAFPPAVWTERASKKYPIKNQDGSSSCVGNGVAKIMGIDEVYEGREYKELSARHIYTRRANKGTEGMFLPDALNISRDGCALESDVPSNGRNETQMNDTSDITPEKVTAGIKYKTAGFVELPVDIESIAAITSIGKGVLLGHRFDFSEWTDFPKPDANSKKSLGHGTAAVDNVLVNGVKYIVMDDSWGIEYAKAGQRYLSEDWIKQRVFYAGYTLNFIFEEQSTIKPKYTFSKWLKVGDRNVDIVALQDILKYEGLFPTNVDSTGLYGPATQRAVAKFQLKYSISSNNGVQVGPATIKKLNQLYS